MPPQRRQSHVPTSNAGGYRQALGRKRAQSLVPTAANRQLVPRKSILKPSPFSFGSNPSAQNENDPPFALRNLEDGTGDNNGMNCTTEMSGNISRKSLRVSFAPLASFRVFETNDNTNSTNPPSSSPTSPSPGEMEPSSPSPRPFPPFKLSNENDYPGRRSNPSPAGRDSVGSDYGEKSMSLDLESDDISEPPTDPIFFVDAANGGSDYGPPSTDFEEGTEDDEDGDGDMEITEAIAMSIDRKRSLSIAQQHELARRSSLASRPPSSTKDVSTAPGQQIKESAEEHSRGEDSTTNTQTSQESGLPKEGTIALGQPLKKPKPPPKAWFKLLALANSRAREVEEEQVEEEQDSEEEMELSSALSRLQQARSSLGFGGQMGDDVDNSDSAQDDSFTNSVSNMDESEDAGGRTLNLSALLGRVSNLEISNEEPEIGGHRKENQDFVRSVPLESTAPLNIQRKEGASGQQGQPRTPASKIFSTPDPSAATPCGISFTRPENNMPNPQRSHSPGVTRVPDLSRPPLSVKSSLTTSIFSAPLTTPSRIPVYVSPTKAKVTALVSPKKRLADAQSGLSDVAQPSPAKKLLLEDPSDTNKPAPIPASLPVAEESASGPSINLLVPRESLVGIRSPSGYFAQRRSLRPGDENPSRTSRSPSPALNEQKAPILSNVPDPQSSGAPSSPPRTGVPNQDEVAIVPIRQTPADEPTADKTTTFTPPTVIVTGIAEDSREDGNTGLEAMDVETEKRESAVPRKSLVSPQMLPPEEDDDVPSISIQEFFLMTDIKFHEYTIPRRSTIHPSQLQGDRRDSSVPPSMADYITAMVVHVPQLELYRLIAKDLQSFIDNSAKNFHEAEEEVAKLTPVLFREYAQASEDGREELLHQLKLIKANKLVAAKERWYEVRSRWIQSLLETVGHGFAELEKDRDALTSIIDQAQVLLPALRHQHAQAQAQLERERTEIEEIENSDPQFVEELMVAIREQSELLESYKTDAAEGSAKIERLEGKLAELEAQRLENVQAIEAAERRIVLNKTSTRAEVIRLQDELEALQVLHSWRVSKLSRQRIELVYSEQFLVSVPCNDYRPIAPSITIKRTERPDKSKGPKEIDLLPLFSKEVLRQSEKYVRSLPMKSIKTIVIAMSDFWTSTAQVRQQLRFLGIKYPLKLESVTDDDGSTKIKATASILLLKHTTKLLVSFILSPEAIGHWPFALREVQCEVKTTYGKIDADEVRNSIMERLTDTTIEDAYACLLDSCVEAVSRYD